MKILSRKNFMKNYVEKIEDLKLENSKLKNRFIGYQESLRNDERFLEQIKHLGMEVNENTRWLFGVVGDIEIPFKGGAASGIVRCEEKDYKLVTLYPLVKVAYIDLNKSFNRNFILIRNNF